VEVERALFSVGDTHAAQGDGEVCGTAIESQMDVELTLDLVKGANLKSPRFSTPGPVTRHLDGAGYEATTGLGPDLMTATREAVARMRPCHGEAAAGRYFNSSPTRGSRCRTPPIASLAPLGAGGLLLAGVGRPRRGRGRADHFLM
jgi:hypothetical protein